MRQQSAVLPVALVHAIRISYQITQHVSDVTIFTAVNNATFAFDAVGGSSLQRHHDKTKAAHHTRKDAIYQNRFLPCANAHNGRRGGKSVSCEDDTASWEAPQQRRRECELPESG